VEWTAVGAVGRVRGSIEKREKEFRRGEHEKSPIVIDKWDFLKI